MECLHIEIFVYDIEVFQGQLNFHCPDGSSKSSRKWNLMWIQSSIGYQIVLVIFISLVTVWAENVLILDNVVSVTV